MMATGIQLSRATENMLLAYFSHECSPTAKTGVFCEVIFVRPKSMIERLTQTKSIL